MNYRLSVLFYFKRGVRETNVLQLCLHTKIQNIVDVMSSGRNKVFKEFSSG